MECSCLTIACANEWLPRQFARITHCITLHHTASHCITLHHTATHCNTLQHTHCSTLQHNSTWRSGFLDSVLGYNTNTAPQILQHTATHCNTLQHTATHCNTHSGFLDSWLGHEKNTTTLQPTCNTHIATHCNINTATHCNTLQHAATQMSGFLDTLSGYETNNVLQTPQHTATHCNTDEWLPRQFARLRDKPQPPRQFAAALPPTRARPRQQRAGARRPVALLHDVSSCPAAGAVACAPRTSAASAKCTGVRSVAVCCRVLQCAAVC